MKRPPKKNTERNTHTHFVFRLSEREQIFASNGFIRLKSCCCSYSQMHRNFATKCNSN